MRKTLGVCLLVLLLTGSVSAGIMQNDSPAPPAHAAEGPKADGIMGNDAADGIIQNDAADGLTAEIVFELLLSVLTLH